jgi:ABC-type sugar transport system substrate-binding protein
MTMVSVADLVVRLPGESKGADAEVAEARRRGIPVVYGVESVVNPGTVYEVTGDAPHTWAEHQAANQQTLDEIAAAVGVKR